MRNTSLNHAEVDMYTAKMRSYFNLAKDISVVAEMTPCHSLIEYLFFLYA